MSLLGVTDAQMKLYSRLIKSRHGIYYFRIQQHGIDRRWSLGTRDPITASIAAYKIGAKITSMKIDPTKIKGWTLKTDGINVELTTEDNDADRKSAQIALEAALEQISLISQQHPQNEPVEVHTPTLSLAKAISEYTPALFQSDQKEKSKRMALSVLNNLKLLLGEYFNMSELDDYIIEDVWLEARLKTVSRTTAKRDLSFIRSFVAWAADRKRNYAPAKLTFAIEAKGENYEYFSQADLKNIFDNLPAIAENPMEFWVVILGLYTGGRIGEIAGMRTEHIFEKSSLQVMRLAGTKTDASDRIIPVHTDLIKLGFLDYVECRRKVKKELLFDISISQQNGPGAKASKFFTCFKNKIGIDDNLKVFHSFRHTITDLMNQASIGDKAGSQYTGHALEKSVRNGNYGRKLLSLEVMQAEVVDKIDWLKYCSWEPNFEVLKKRAIELNYL